MHKYYDIIVQYITVWVSAHISCDIVQIQSIGDENSILIFSYRKHINNVFSPRKKKKKTLTMLLLNLKIFVNLINMNSEFCFIIVIQNETTN